MLASGTAARLVRCIPRSYEPELQQQLWTASEQLTGVRYCGDR